MKKTQIKELLSNIKATRMSFIAIMLFVLLSVGVFTGISWTSPALWKSADEVFDEGNCYDIEIQFPNGLTDEDLQKIAEIEGADQVETGYSSLQMMLLNGKECVTKITSLMENMNTPVQVEGTLPETKGEIAINKSFATKNKIKIGETLSFKHDAGSKDSDGMTYLTADEYKVTALVESPYYISYSTASYGFANIGSGYVQCLAFVAPESIDTSAYQGYTQAFIRCDALRGLGTNDAKYEEILSGLESRITALGDNLSEERYGAMREEVDRKLQDGRDKLAEAEQKITDGKKAIKEGRKTLKEGKAKYKQQKKKLDAGYETLVSSQQKYDKAKRQYTKSNTLVKSMKGYRKELKNDTLKYDDMIKMRGEIEEFQKDKDTKDLYPEKTEALETALDSTFENVTKEEWDNDPEYREKHREEILTASETMLNQISGELTESKKTLDSGKKKLDKGWAEYNVGAAKIAEAKTKIEAGETKLAKSEKKLKKLEKQYEEGKATLEYYEKQATKLKNYDWNVLSRKENGGALMVNQFGELAESLRFSMAALFIIIGLLVSYSSVSRIVRDQIVSIGTKKALGLRGKEITLSYLAYSGMAVIAGGILGLLAGTFGVETVLAKPIGNRFIMGPYEPYFSVSEAALLVGTELVLILLTTWLACRSVLKRQAIELLKGENTAVGKRRFFENWKIWEKTPLITQTVINNCLNDKKRVFGTIIGIAGCTALIVTAVLVNNNIQKSFDRQYEEVYGYDTVIRYTASNPNAPEEIRTALSEVGATGTQVYTTPYKLIQPNGKIASITLTVPFDEEVFGDFVTMKKTKENAETQYEDGVWVSAAYSEHLKAEPGDKLEIMDSEGRVYEFTIQGFYEHYLLNNQLIMSRDVYLAKFGEDHIPNAFLVDSGEGGIDEIKEALAGTKGIRMIKDDYQSAYNVFNEFSKITRAVIILYLVLSGLMALIVLFDLYSVFIEEKKRELIILMINGYSVKDARRYIYRDTIVLTILGIIAGVIFGVIMGDITIWSLEPDIAHFVKGIDWTACLAGALTSGILAIVLCWLAMRRIAKYQLSDINKL